MNHLIICREYPPAPSGGGIGTYARHMAELLARHGETVHVIGQRWPGASRATETQLGGRLIDSTSKKLAGEFFQKFSAIVGHAPAGVARPGKEGCFRRLWRRLFGRRGATSL